LQHRDASVLGLQAPLRSAVTCSVAGFGIIRGGSELLETLRRNPVAAPGTPLPAGFLKHAEKQTVAGLAAVYQAIYNFDLARVEQRHWGVIAAPTFLGRSGMADALARFAVEGAWGISPHLIPHQSLHAVSGTISQSLRIHGPNFGVGGAPGAVVEAVLAAASLLALPGIPGIWLVLTDHEREFIPVDRAEPASKCEPEPDCRALALALIPGRTSSIGLSLQICPEHSRVGVTANAMPVDTIPADMHGCGSLCDVGDLIEAFAHEECRGSWRLGTSGWLRLLREDAESPC